MKKKVLTSNRLDSLSKVGGFYLELVPDNSGRQWWQTMNKDRMLEICRYILQNSRLSPEIRDGLAAVEVSLMSGRYGGTS